ncbi:MAG: RNA polymerase sporulation sigma factor SigK [Firmicutes bacterium]|nr:RNA polymerase sporulation sigma factor SigK [Bacillota bacterium]MDY5531057.1 RNA polymerase sporulation sigma factor SigK [Pumilibacteraceae bacterium]
MIIETLLSFFSGIFCFSAYVSGGGSFPPPLKPEEERACVEACKNGDLKAREKLIKHNLRLVAHVVKKYSLAGEADDLISIGTMGLIKGVETYEYGKGSQLSTYAAKCIDNEILMYIRANKKRRGDLSLSDPAGVDKDGNEITLMDVIPSPDEGIFTRVENAVTIKQIEKIVEEKLKPREKTVMNLRYGLNGESAHTQLEVAAIMDISRSYVSRIEKKAMAKISEFIL